MGQAARDRVVDIQGPLSDDVAGASKHGAVLRAPGAMARHWLAMPRGDSALMATFQDGMGGDQRPLFEDMHLIRQGAKVCTSTRRMDALFDIESTINGRPAAERLVVRQTLSAPRVVELETWMRDQRAKLSRHDPVAKALDHMLTRWAAFTGFLGDGRSA